MKEINITKKLTVFVISLMMALSVSPAWAFAGEGEAEDDAAIPEGTIEEAADETVEEPTESLTDEAVEEVEAVEAVEESEASVEAKASDGEEPELTPVYYGKPSGSLLENTSRYRQSMRIYGIYMYRSNGSRVSSDRYGDAVLIESNGKYLLMDTGSITPIKNSSKEYHSTLVSTLKKIGVRELDVYISHLHQDHTGGLEDICNNFKVNRLYLPDLKLCENYYTPSGLSIESRYVHNLDIAEGKIGELVFLKPSFREHKDIVYDNKVYGANARITDRFNVGAAVFTVIGPVGSYTVNQFKSQDGNCGTKNGHCLNNCSLTSLVQCGSFRFLTAGDTERQEEEKQISRYGSSLNCDMLKVSHHALSTSTKENYLNCVRPMWSFEEDHGFSSSVSTQTKRLRNYGYNYGVAAHNASLIVDVNSGQVRLIKDMNNNGKADESAMAGWVSVTGNSKRYQYYTPAGYICKGWMWKDKTLYYMDPESGFRYTGKYNFNGVKVEFDKNGKLISHKRPAKVKIKSAKALKKHKARIKWSKTKRASAYQIFRSTKKKSGYVYIKTVSKKKLSTVNKKLKRGKKYYYKVRAVRYVAGGVMYGAFSKPIKVKAR